MLDRCGLGLTIVRKGICLYFLYVVRAIKLLDRSRISAQRIYAERALLSQQMQLKVTTGNSGENGHSKAW